MKVITEDILRQIIRETLLEMVGEGGTNMHSLYHFTNSWYLPRIIRSGKLITNDTQFDKRNGKSFVSFTRHKSNLEGFAMARDCDVRIEVDGQKLSSVRDSDVYSYEYYSPKRPWNQRVYGGDRSAKFMYQQARKERRTGECDYMHQAEESFETEFGAITLSNILIEIDIVVEPGFLARLKRKDDDDTSVLKEANYINQTISTNSPLLDKTFVYLTERDFNLQTQNKIPIRKFFEMMLTANSGGAEMRKAVEQ